MRLCARSTARWPYTLLCQEECELYSLTPEPWDPETSWHVLVRILECQVQREKRWKRTFRPFARSSKSVENKLLGPFTGIHISSVFSGNNGSPPLLRPWLVGLLIFLTVRWNWDEDIDEILINWFYTIRFTFIHSTCTYEICPLYVHFIFIEVLFCETDPNGAYGCLWQVSSAILEYYDGLLQKCQAKRNRCDMTRTLREAVVGSTSFRSRRVLSDTSEAFDHSVLSDSPRGLWWQCRLSSSLVGSAGRWAVFFENDRAWRLLVVSGVEAF